MLLTREFSRVAVSYAHLRTMLAGLSPNVHSVGILTAWNPKGKKASPEYNRNANRALTADLHKKDLGPISIGGVYEGAREGSLLVPNMSRGLLLYFCRKYDQESVIYGGRTEEDGESAFQFEMLDRDGNLISSKETEVIGKEDPFQKGYSHLGEDDPDWKPKYPWRLPRSQKKFMVPFKFD